MKGSEQLKGRSEERARVIVLPSVCAVGERKPCLPVGAVVRMRETDPPSAAKDYKGGAAKDDKRGVIHAEAYKVHGSGDVAFYRKYTEAMLRRYAVMSMESGRVPSMLGREMFRGKVTSYKVQGFDDAVIFCCDVEACLKKLSDEEQRVIQRVAVQQYTHGEAAGMLGVSLRTCITRYAEAVDRLTRMFLKVKLLEPQKACQ